MLAYIESLATSLPRYQYEWSNNIDQNQVRGTGEWALGKQVYLYIRVSKATPAHGARAMISCVRSIWYRALRTYTLARSKYHHIHIAFSGK